MSLLTHRCVCGHFEFFHVQRLGRPVDCSHGACSCRALDVDPASELIPTFGPTGKPIDRCVEPGATWGNGLVACSCEACRVAYTAGNSGAA